MYYVFLFTYIHAHSSYHINWVVDLMGQHFVFLKLIKAYDIVNSVDLFEKLKTCTHTCAFVFVLIDCKRQLKFILSTRIFGTLPLVMASKLQ